MSENPPPGEIAKAEAEWHDDKPLELLYGGSIVVQLGAQLYPSVTASLAELVSNAWDADATHAWVDVPLDTEWDRNTACIEVLDDGLGMSRRDAQFSYLVVGRERRKALKTDRTQTRNRMLHGRKGIGKLAAFGTAHTLEVTTKQEGKESVAFRLDYQRLRDFEPGQSSPVTELDPHTLPPLHDPDGRLLEHGTRVRLMSLQAKRRPNASTLMTSMRRRFAIDESEMQVLINDEPLRRFDLDFALLFPRDGAPPGIKSVDGFGVETVDDGTGKRREVRWWIGFTDKPVHDEILQGVTVLVRGKQAQRGFKFERTRGTEGQLGYEYLVGEVHADWIDEGIEEDGDLISSDRDTLQLEDERLQGFVEWGQKRLRWALAERSRHLQRGKVDRWKTDMPQVGRVLGQVTARERDVLGRVAQRLSRIDGIEDEAVADVMGRVLQVREQNTAARVAAEIRSIGDAASDSTWQRVAETVELERRVLRATVDARIAALEAVAELLADGDDFPDLQGVLTSHPWLVDLAFDRSIVQPTSGSPPRGGALLIISPAPWGLEDLPVTLVALWPRADANADIEAWTEALAQLQDVALTRRLLVGPLPGVTDEPVLTWAATLARSLGQHEAWQRHLVRP